MTAPSTAPRTHVRWWICLIVFLATTILYSDRSFLAQLKSTLAGVIPGWTDTEFGTINSSFLGAYAFGLLFVGRLIDRFGVKIGYAVTIAFWSLGALSHTLATTVQGFIFARIFLGLAESGNFPAAIKTIAQWFPVTQRAFATSVFNSGANVGSILAPALVAWLLSRGYSWHAPFYLAGCWGVVWVVTWWIFYTPPEKNRWVSAGELALIQGDSDVQKEAAPPVSWLSLVGRSATWSYIVAKFLTDPVWFFLLFWLPDYFKKTRGLDIKASWPHLATIYAVVTALSLIGGYAPGYLINRGWTVTRARKTCLFVYAVLMVPVLLVGLAGDWTVVLLIGLAGAAHQSWSANLFTTVSDMFPRSSIASVVGLGTTAGAVGSMAFQYLCGHILDLYGPGHASEAYFLLFAYASMAYLVAFGLQHLLAPKFELISFRSDETI